MNVAPKHYLLDGSIKDIPGPNGALIIECEVTSPPSRRGQTVYVFFTPAEVTQALLLLRDAAVRARL